MREYLWGVLVRVYPAWLRRIYKMDLAPGVVISWKATLDKSIGEFISENIRGYCRVRRF